MAAGVPDSDVLIAALLHDVVEDTGTTLEEIESKFGAVVAGIVRECSDDKKLPKVRHNDCLVLRTRLCQASRCSS